MSHNFVIYFHFFLHHSIDFFLLFIVFFFSIAEFLATCRLYIVSFLTEVENA